MIIKELQNKILDVINKDTKRDSLQDYIEKIDYKKLQSQTENKGGNVDVYA